MLFYTSEHKPVVEKLQKAKWPNELIQKYINYVTSKRRIVATGRTAYRDSTRSKTYKAEFAFEAKFKKIGEIKKFKTEAEAQKYVNRVLASKLWQQLAPKRKTINVVAKNFGGATAGRSWGGLIELDLTCGMNQYVVLHEMAHSAGNMHHDVSFRQDLIKLVSRFMGTEAAKMLKAEFRAQKLKMNVVRDFKDPERWLSDYNRMAIARKAASKKVK